MKGHPFRIRLPRKLVSSVQFRFAVTFTVLVAILLTLINTYPTRASRDIVFAEKQSALTNRAAVVSSSLSLLDNLTPDNTRQVARAARSARPDAHRRDRQHRAGRV